MPNNSSQNRKLAKKLADDFPQFSFVPSEASRWSPSEKTIHFQSGNDVDLLHELGHALLGHDGFSQDVELLRIERDAWEKARSIAPKYDVKIDDDAIENALDGYRDWLHARSTCPTCSQTGLQSAKTGVYSCINCDARWTANDARNCGLRRRLTV